MLREIIKIDEEKCDGCGLCIPNCPEGALQVIDGKARLISDLFCDGLGACIGHCPRGAITVEKREAEPYDEKKVMKNIIKQGENVIKAHLLHLAEHNEIEYLNQALEVLKEENIMVDFEQVHEESDAEEHAVGCPGARAMSFGEEALEAGAGGGSSATAVKVKSALTHWPVQMHLISPRAPYFKGSDLLLCADCVAYALGDFHSTLISGKTITIACPKLDSGQDIYLEKLISLIEDAKINTLTVTTMEVPCCTGLLELARRAAEKAERKVPLKWIVISVKGEILGEEWV